jgi:RNA polymerase sigma factor (sigma-70 family)
VRETRNLIAQATDAAATLVERHEAFGELVTRFQDLAYGCAYAVLNDFYLAEDAAQEAFIAAWQKLNQLRQPEAFPGWLRRIVLTECNRLTRGKRLRFVPLEAGLDVAAADIDPQARAEQTEVREKVWAAIRALPEGERLVTTLFYINEYSQNEIGQFLELPVTTVVKRLYSARRRLKERMLEMFKDDLQSHRPSRNADFADQVSARLRPADAPDWEPIAALAYGLEPDYRADDEVWLRNRQQFDETRYLRRHYVAEHAETGQLLGYGSIEQTIFLPKYRLFLVIAPQWLQTGVGDLLLDRLMADLREVNAITVWHRNYAQLTDILGFLAERGFVETIRVWDLRLNLAEVDTSPFLPVLEQVAARGISITTFAEERERDPESLQKLHEFLNSVKADDPQRQPFTPAPFEAAVRWCASSHFLPDACFIAKHGKEYVGFSDLILYELVAGGLTHGFTGVAPQYRRQGVATALKLRAIEYARQHGYRVIRAFSYASQTSMLALNEKLGFRQAFSYVTLEKCLKEVSAVDPQIYDAYAGQYAPDPEQLSKHGLPDALTVTIKKAGDRLISEVRDMQDELLPESETRFFIKERYRQVEFFRDEQGQVTHLIYREPGVEVRANKIN